MAMGQYLDYVLASRTSMLKAGELLSSSFELQEGRRVQVSCRPPIPKIIFPFIFSQPGNPSSNLSKSLFLFAKPLSCSVSYEGRKQLAALQKQPPLKPAHPGVLQGSKHLSVKHLSAIALSRLPHPCCWEQSITVQNLIQGSFLTFLTSALPLLQP